MSRQRPEQEPPPSVPDLLDPPVAPPGDGWLRSAGGSIRVRLWVADAPSAGQPFRIMLPAVPREGDLVRTPWAAARRVGRVGWDIDPAREPVLIVDVHI